MSSTNRCGERAEDDFYATPAWVTDALLTLLGPLDGKRILEPSAGAGSIVQRLLARGAHADLVVAVELDPGRATMLRQMGVTVICSSFETFAELEKPGFDLVVMNPPFTFAEEHIALAISLLAPGGFCAALERLSFGAAAKRAPFRARFPYDKIELAQRPSFFSGEVIGGSTAAQGSLFDPPPLKLPDSGSTDSADYAWFCFGRWPEGCAVPWRERLGPTCGGRFMVVEDGPDGGRSRR